jgi:hypothetical protein
MTSISPTPSSGGTAAPAGRDEELARIIDGTSDFASVREYFSSNDFFDGFASSEEGALRDFIDVELVEQRARELTPLVIDGDEVDRRYDLSDQEARFLRDLLAALPQLVRLINEGMRFAKGGDREAYFASFFGDPSSCLEFIEGNAAYNAQNVGKLIVAVLEGDLRELHRIADELNEGDMNPGIVINDFHQTEAKVRQDRDIKEDEGAAARDFYNNNVRGLLGSDEQIEAPNLDRLRRLWRATA